MKEKKLRYKTKEELKKDIEMYFESCFEKKEGKEIQIRPFTISGLGLAIGLSRKELIEYEVNDKFYEIIKEAENRCECYAEQRLFDKDGFNAAKFVLSNNFGWSEKEKEKNNNGEIFKIGLKE